MVQKGLFNTLPPLYPRIRICPAGFFRPMYVELLPRVYSRHIPGSRGRHDMISSLIGITGTGGSEHVRDDLQHTCSPIAYVAVFVVMT
jgi:hypothetical protein